VNSDTFTSLVVVRELKRIRQRYILCISDATKIRTFEGSEVFPNLEHFLEPSNFVICFIDASLKIPLKLADFSYLISANSILKD